MKKMKLNLLFCLFYDIIQWLFTPSLFRGCIGFSWCARLKYNQIKYNENREKEQR